MKKKPRELGKLVILEGPDGVGKSTAANLITQYFAESLNSFELVTFPGKEENTLGKLVYDLHHQPESFGVKNISQTSNQILHIAAHVDALERLILPKLREGQNLVLDRFWWSTWVYGIVSGVRRQSVKRMIELENLYWKGFLPSAVFLLSREGPIDRKVSLSDWRRLGHEYKVLAEREKTKYPVIKIINHGTEEDLKNILVETVKEKLVTGKHFGEVKFPNSSQVELPFKTHGDSLTKPENELNIHVSRLHPVKPTVVFDTYWRFATERQKVFFNKLNNCPPPWTEDSIISQYKFTNAYRASDRVSQYLIRQVIYNENYPSSNEEVFFRILLFKLFNKIETWTLLEKSLGKLTYEAYDFDQYDRVLSNAMSDGQRIYSAAYIMPSGGRTLGYSVKHRNHLSLLEKMMKDELHQRLADCPTMQKGFDLLRNYPTIGNFLAYQYITDINYSEITDFTEMEFVIPGPGSLDGIRKCFADRGGLSEVEIIRYVADIQEAEFERLGLTFQTLWGRKLQLIDCQNLFCEVDKYSRVKHPEISGITGRTRIKQIYRTNRKDISYWYPPKWKINNKIIKSVTT